MKASRDSHAPIAGARTTEGSTVREEQHVEYDIFTIAVCQILHVTHVHSGKSSEFYKTKKHHDDVSKAPIVCCDVSKLIQQERVCARYIIVCVSDSFEMTLLSLYGRNSVSSQTWTKYQPNPDFHPKVLQNNNK